MDEPKSARYTVILGVCLLLCLLMLGRMLVSRADSETPPDGSGPRFAQLSCAGVL